MKILAQSSEVWKEIPGFEGYQVSSRGSVRTFWDYATGHGRGARTLRDYPVRVMRQAIGHAGHRRVMIGRGDTRANQSVHRLVLLAFVGPCPVGHVACHNNGDPSDNRPENLRWGTPSENTLDAVRHGTHSAHRGTAQKHSKLNDQLVRDIRATRGKKSSAAWADDIGCCRQLVDKVRAGKIWGHVV